MFLRVGMPMLVLGIIKLTAIDFPPLAWILPGQSWLPRLTANHLAIFDLYYTSWLQVFLIA